MTDEEMLSYLIEYGIHSKEELFEKLKDVRINIGVMED